MSNKCECCGAEYKLSLKDKWLRKAVRFSSKRIVGLKEATEAAQNYCNPCWKAHLKPFTEA